MQEKHISVEGDAGLVVAGNATHDGATANNQTSNVINIHHHGAAMNDARPLTMDGRMNRLAQCSSCAVAHLQHTRMRRWLVATSGLALAVSTVAAYMAIVGGPASDPTLTLQGSLCHHEGKAHSPGGVARMADTQLYTCTPPVSGGVAFWAPTEQAAKRQDASS
jgi:hypothetical protein